MEPISLTTFVDFVSKQGMPKLTVVRRALNSSYDVRADFYKRIREALVRIHRDGAPVELLEEVMERVEHSVKRKNFPRVVDGYKHFKEQVCDKAASVDWFDPPRGTWEGDGVAIRVNPELGLVIDGTPHLLKLYFKEEKLQGNRVQVILHLIRSTHSDRLPPGCRVAVLDLRRGRFLQPKIRPEVPAQLKAEAAYWKAVVESLSASS